MLGNCIAYTDCMFWLGVDLKMSLYSAGQESYMIQRVTPWTLQV